MNSTFTDASPELLRAVVDHSLTPIYAARALHDEVTGELVDFQIYFCNPAFCQRVRRTEADLRAQTLRTLFPTLVRTGFFDCYRQVVETGEPFEGEQEYPGPNGHFWYQASVKKLGDGLVVNFIDITDYRQAREELRKSAQLLDDIIQVLPNGLVIAEAVRERNDETHEGTITDFLVQVNNPAARQLAGLSPNDIGRPILEIDPALRETGLFDRYISLVQTGEPFSLEYNFRGHDLCLDVSKLNDGFLATFTNITDRKRAEVALQAQTEQLAATLNGSLNGIIAMQPIRTPEGIVTDFQMCQRMVR